MSSLSSWTCSMATGGRPAFLANSSAGSSVFSGDGRFNIVALSHQLRVYFISTRRCVRSIDVDLSDMCDLKLDPSNGSNVLIFHSSGAISTINWKDKVMEPILSTTNLQVEYPLLSVLAVSKDAYYVVLGKKDKKSGISPHTRYIHRIEKATLNSTNLADIHNSIKYAVSIDSTKLAFVTSDHDIVLIDLVEIFRNDQTEVESESENRTQVSTETIKFPFKSAITSVAVSNDSTVALGTSAGAIQILYGGLASEKPQRLLKWHIDQVRSLHFTPDNNYLLSGGLEKVLVFWQLETDKTQFLPRLNGTIDKISIDYNKSDYYTLLLNSVSEEENNYEILVVSSVDLVSRLSVNTIRPKFSNNVKTTLAKTKKKYIKAETNFDKSKLRHDYSSVFEVHPKTKNLYFPNESIIQAYDLVKNEQSFIQNAAPTLPTGKVRSETKLLDPSISLLSFTNDGEWMCTFDSVSTSEIDNLLSKDDKQYALKFWKFVESNTGNKIESANSSSNKTGYWELSTKIIDPHGNLNPILAICAAPSSYFNGQAILTVDNKGGLRIWRPSVPKEIYQTIGKNGARSQQTAWTLRKSRPSGALTAEAVAVCWSEDSSVIFLGHESTVLAINSKTFEELPESVFKVPTLSGSRIRSLSIVDNNLIVLSKTRISSFNLLTGEFNELVAKVNTTYGGKHTIAVDIINKLICLAVNYYNDEGDFEINSKVLIFKPNQLKPLYSHTHKQGISSIRYYNSSFVFVDLNSRIGIIQPTSNSPISLANNDDDLAKDMNNMLINAQATADLINNRSLNTNTNSNVSSSQDIDESYEFNRVIDLNTFQPLFEKSDSASVETLFDLIVKVLK
ncbi:Nucleolar protin NAN1 (U3 small nucleolar RNA-associated protein 17) (U3 snoRNA-associated protein 17) [Scheffersomyces stipitis CBS 6054]|uniref:Nucleolar protin NAN1 (U3 small nucleolar RNA-associated protein 17) (U3 snoRNA-associated protein 17) n=1 Tax=Scheffersomyces stipitis (strain ATCC 58785 / CBS 6054 / NBRC 10063 / NRRL Y-11545) TaxID=322104 RepID=A3GGI7_PICST|nr:Nucleolar protin NAN1 (U3 small nucleolar RNA-associated protein 17) (U3 snoRNA-associated protein 17) [Scheffersomyces stipitis CBS 6054]EAZ63940.2 Nucleolar protin NAN1 (U3 small nucleolar RNA-associated protein 17) (U3 snoRNA-associated protein 17) [Scheffersomyces stipitis CBS 6054]